MNQARLIAETSQPGRIGPAVRWASTGRASGRGWQVAWAQIIGRHHPRITEDAVAHRLTTLPGAPADLLNVAVADGVGGGARGDVAADTLVTHCQHMPTSAYGQAADMAEWLKQAEAVVQQALRQVTYSPGAATLAAAWLGADGHGHVMRVGDARAYLHAPDAAPPMQALTQDQTYDFVQETPPPGCRGDDPARMVGTNFMGAPELQSLHLQPGQTLLLCSDGIHKSLSADTLTLHLQAASALDEAARDLCLAALDAGSDDDITVLLAQRVVLSNIYRPG